MDTIQRFTHPAHHCQIHILFMTLFLIHLLFKGICRVSTIKFSHIFQAKQISVTLCIAQGFSMHQEQHTPHPVMQHIVGTKEPGRISKGHKNSCTVPLKEAPSLDFIGQYLVLDTCSALDKCTNLKCYVCMQFIYNHHSNV